MKMTVTAGNQVKFYPTKRCKKTRKEYTVVGVDVEIPEVQETEFPLAIRSHNYNSGVEEITDYRAYNGKLYAKHEQVSDFIYSHGYCNGYSTYEHQSRFDAAAIVVSDNYNEVSKILRRAYDTKFVVFNGYVYTASACPVYWVPDEEKVCIESGANVTFVSDDVFAADERSEMMKRHPNIKLDISSNIEVFMPEMITRVYRTKDFMEFVSGWQDHVQDEHPEFRSEFDTNVLNDVIERAFLKSTCDTPDGHKAISASLNLFADAFCDVLHCYSCNDIFQFATKYFDFAKSYIEDESNNERQVETGGAA